MLRRNSKYRQRRPLSRSKSTHSIIRDPVDSLQSIDPATARRDAHIAATLSYSRAHGDTATTAHMSIRSEDNAGFGPGCDRRMDVSTGPSCTEDLSHATGMTHLSDDPQRRQSVRFTGPKARLRRNLAPRASQNRASVGEQKTSAVTANQSLKDIAELHGKAFGFQSLTRNYLRSLKAAEQSSATEENETIPHPGQRKLRKSRSIRSRYAALNACSDETKLGLSSEPLPFGLGGDATLRPLSQPSRELALKLARERFQQQLGTEGHQPLRSQPSGFFRSRNKRSESSMALRKSLRNSSNTSAALSSAFSGQSIEISKQSGLRNTARKVSHSLRAKVKGLFNRPKLSQGFSHLQDEDTQDCHDGGESGLEDDPTPAGEVSMSCVASYIPSLHAVPSSQQMQSRKGSMESLDAPGDQLADDKSRVTSWTDSVANTLPSQSAAGEWERQRLSVIRETGAHMSSSSIPRPPQSLSPEVTVSSDRVYAALMKRLENINGPEDQHRVQEVGGTAMLGDASTENSPRGPVVCPTIRCVPSDDDVFSDDRSLCGRPADVSLPFRSFGSVNDPATDTVTHLSHGNNLRGSPRSTKSKTISHRSSAFFSSPSTHLFRATSPYRRALQQMQKPTPVERHDQQDGGLSVPSPIVLPSRRPSTVGSDNGQTKASEPSLYSNTGEDVVANPWNIGDPAVDRCPRPPSSSKPSAHSNARDISSVSSVEWKQRLSSEVASRESSPLKLIGMGHVRELTEIESPDERRKTEMSSRGSIAPGTPLQPIHSNSRSSSAVRATHEPREQGAQKAENDHPSIRKAGLDSAHKAPVIPIRSALRAIPPRGSVPHAQLEGEPRQPGSPEQWPLVVPVRSAGSCGRGTKGAHRTRSRLDTVMTHSWQTDPLGSPEKPQRPSTASPGHRAEWGTDRTLRQLRLGDHKGGLENPSAVKPNTDRGTKSSGSKRMVDLFLSSRRRRSQEPRSRSTSKTSVLAFL
ncbi:hypothetical protein NLU13_2416 [Sarocladium strictum]|uniref:Uncharacterized protein n=1 Tax=Sarocladium strictum TaxID=5046 RepID=A0AA39GVK5_SARSR|nr:hypothetical protein NLU13_2416 [Sarocladium strictum]